MEYHPVLTIESINYIQSIGIFPIIELTKLQNLPLYNISKDIDRLVKISTE